MTKNLLDINPLIKDYYLDEHITFEIPVAKKPLRKIVEGTVGVYKRFTHMCDEQNRPLSKYLHNKRYTITYHDDRDPEKCISVHEADKHTQVYNRRGLLVRDRKIIRNGEIYEIVYKYNDMGVCIYRDASNFSTGEHILMQVLDDEYNNKMIVKKNEKIVIEIDYSNDAEVKCRQKSHEFVFGTLFPVHDILKKSVSVCGIDFDKIVPACTYLTSDVCKIRNEFDKESGEILSQTIVKSNFTVRCTIDWVQKGNRDIKRVVRNIFTPDGNATIIVKIITKAHDRTSDGTEYEMSVVEDDETKEYVLIKYDKEGDKI